MHLNHIGIQNFRCFGQLTLTLEPGLTVLVAENGGGKTAALDAIALGLSPFVQAMLRLKAPTPFSPNDVRLALSPKHTMEAVTPVHLSFEGSWQNQPLAWTMTYPATSRRQRAPELAELTTKLSQTNQRWVAAGPHAAGPVFPLLAYYGTGRLWPATPPKTKTAPLKPTTARAWGYAACLSSSSRYNQLVEWFRRYAYEAQQAQSPHAPQALLHAVQTAVNAVLEPTGWRDLVWDFVADDLAAQHPTLGRLPVRQLSDGLRTAIALVADLAHRAVRLNPQHGEHAPTLTPGLALIDEVDLHLHPTWQQHILGALQQAFPAVQFVVTTHSPQVLTTVRREQLRVLKRQANDQWLANPPTFSPLGQEASDALAHIMNTHPRPTTLPILTQVYAYEQLARAGQRETPAAHQILKELRAAGFEFQPTEQALLDWLSKKHG